MRLNKSFKNEVRREHFGLKGVESEKRSRVDCDDEG
jgi:hypothetical protein